MVCTDGEILQVSDADLAGAFVCDNADFQATF
jgi:hypothetical protein